MNKKKFTEEFKVETFMSQELVTALILWIGR